MIIKFYASGRGASLNFAPLAGGATLNFLPPQAKIPAPPDINYATSPSYLHPGLVLHSLTYDKDINCLHCPVPKYICPLTIPPDVNYGTSHHEPWAPHHFELQLTRKFGVHIHSFYIRNRFIRNQYLIFFRVKKPSTHVPSA